MPTSTPARRRTLGPLGAILWILLLTGVAFTLGCGEDPTPRPPAVLSCPSGSLARADGSCMPVGIQGCADIFMEDDGLCHPGMDKCPAGTIPKFDEGCVPVGIQDCAEIFMEDDGLCHPSTDRCPAGTIPKFDEGCVPVGIQGCAEIFMEDDGLCHPSMDKCPADTFAVPRQGCVPIDGSSGCGSGTWGDLQDIAGVTTIWVDPSAAASGDGSKVNPVVTIAEALALVPQGGRIALGTGIYDEPIYVTKAMTIEGRCPSMVRVQGTAMSGPTSFIVWVDSTDDVTLRNLELGGAGVGILATDTAGLAIEWVHVRNAAGTGMVFGGWATEATIMRSWIENTLLGGELDGWGVLGWHGARVSLAESAITTSRRLGIAALEIGTEVALKDSLVDDTLPGGDGLDGWGVLLMEGARVTSAGSAITRSHEYGTFSLGYATKMTLSNSLIEDTRPEAATGILGIGVTMDEGSKATISGTAIINNQTAGISTRGTGTEATLAASVVAGTQPMQIDGSFGHGVVAERGATMTLSDCTVSTNHGLGIAAFESSTEVTVTGTLIERQDTYGIAVQWGAALSLDRCGIVENQEHGIVVLDTGPDVLVTNSLVARTLYRTGDADGGAGVAADHGGRIKLSANAIIDNNDTGLFLQSAGTEVEATGNLIAGTLARGDDHSSGRGVNVQDHATLTLESNAIFANREVGIYAGGDGALLTAVHNLIEETRPRESDGTGGHGVAIEYDAQATLEANAIIANHDAGLFAFDHSSIIATNSLVEGTLPRESDGRLGVGVVGANGATLQLSSSIVHDNRTSAIQVDDATAFVAGSLIDTVTAGTIVVSDLGTVEDVGDGILATAGSTVDITDSRIQRCFRAGLFFDSSSGTLSGVVSTDNRFGLVLQGAVRPIYESGGNQLTGNTAQDIVLGGDLPVPDAPSPVPRAPSPSP